MRRDRAAALVAAALADAVFGDPPRLHPVAGFGMVANALERKLWRPRRGAGVLYAAVLVGAATAVTVAATRSVARTPLSLPFAVAVIWDTLAGRSLAEEATALAGEVERDDLAAARRRAPALMGRDPRDLGAPELCRAAVESVAENTADAVVGPALWAAVAGAPGAVAYRAVNTLDSLVGYRDDRFLHFGWAAARLDDVLTWPAARLGAILTCMLAPAVGGTGAGARAIVRRDARCHPSPNAGLLEAAFAGALGVRLGGVNRYGARVEHRPELGDGPRPRPHDVVRAVRLSGLVGGAAICLCALVASRTQT